MQQFTSAEWQSWERFYRANFINSLTGFKSASLIGTINAQGVPNLGMFSSMVHIGSDPALIGFINRPVAAAPHTLANIKSNGFYTVNHIHPNFLAQAHQTSAKYPDEVNEFSEVGLTEEYIAGVQVPFVQESHIKYLLSLKEIIPIQLNDTFLVIGQLEQVLIDPSLQPTTDGFLHLDQAGSICSNGLDAYYKTELIDRYTYAKPEKPANTL
ncbi:MAG: flavin reductase [Sediminibacterium sp.]|nr:flavin reductase [Sediminibacterium sp.]MBP6144662.1 flavin reductase [Sediminibacterium sp.]